MYSMGGAWMGIAYECKYNLLSLVYSIDTDLEKFTICCTWSQRNEGTLIVTHWGDADANSCISHVSFCEVGLGIGYLIAYKGLAENLAKLWPSHIALHSDAYRLHVEQIIGQA